MLNEILGDCIFGRRLGRIGETFNIPSYAALGEVCVKDRFDYFL